jgi:seryl-tRNA synthetase
MLDIRFIRENHAAVQQNAINKGYDVDVSRLLELDEKRRELQTKVEDLRKKRNELSSQAKGVKPSLEQIASGKQVKELLSESEKTYQAVDDEYIAILKKIPNMASDDVKVGLSEDENEVSKIVGEPKKYDFAVKNHAEIATGRGWLDKERASKVSGSRFAYIEGDLVKLQFAIIQYVIDVLSDQKVLEAIIAKHGLNVAPKPLKPVLPPYMIRTDLYDAMDRLEPREDRYKIEGEDLWLEGSAEHVLGSKHADEIFEESDLPVRYIGYATSFRKEAGTYGKDMEGFLRMHQFDKLEMESFCVGENGIQEHLLFVAIQEYLLSSLGLPYRVINKCTFDIGKPNARGIDMEVWLPGQQKYRETHTADYMTDYQARRLNTRVRRANGSLEFIHTNDATAFALGRIMIAIIENNQTSDARVKIPEVLRGYVGGREVL